MKLERYFENECGLNVKMEKSCFVGCREALNVLQVE